MRFHNSYLKKYRVLKFCQSVGIVTFFPNLEFTYNRIQSTEVLSS